MSNGSTKPIIFLAFANDRDDRVRDRYLRNLPEEARRLQRALAAAEREELCEVDVPLVCFEPGCGSRGWRVPGGFGL